MVDLAECLGSNLQGEEKGGASGLLQEEPGLVHLCLRDYLAIQHPDPVLLRSKLSGGGQAPKHLCLLWSRLLLWLLLLAWTEKRGSDGDTDENHFQPVCGSVSQTRVIQSELKEIGITVPQRGQSLPLQWPSE
jgi:hypothetical protein